ncbi:hypothetical protein CBM2599_A150216 [Cupriavidus taiwanensis]|nr:hypothetical protein CBM2599_A150216 [Cupriavidus taiwanensis]
MVPARLAPATRATDCLLADVPFSAASMLTACMVVLQWSLACPLRTGRRLRAGLSPDGHACASSLLSTLGHKPPYNQEKYCLSEMVHMHAGIWCDALKRHCPPHGGTEFG